MRLPLDGQTGAIGMTTTIEKTAELKMGPKSATALDVDKAHVSKEYPGTDKAEETLAILDFLELRAKQLGAINKGA